MIHLKKFENYKYNTKKPNFNVGDTVICIDSINSDLIKNKKYIIEELYKGEDDFWRCKLIGIKNMPFLCYRFMTEIDLNINKYNL